MYSQRKLNMTWKSKLVNIVFFPISYEALLFHSRIVIAKLIFKGDNIVKNSAFQAFSRYL